MRRYTIIISKKRLLLVLTFILLISIYMYYIGVAIITNYFLAIIGFINAIIMLISFYISVR